VPGSGKLIVFTLLNYAVIDGKIAYFTGFPLLVKTSLAMKRQTELNQQIFAKLPPKFRLVSRFG